MADKNYIGFLRTANPTQCFGCEACVQICPHSALSMKEDEEGFRYPQLNTNRCVECGLCNRTCPIENPVLKNEESQEAFGGYAKNDEIRCLSTSGGAFSCIVEAWCKKDYVIFGAVSVGLDVFHSYITDKKQIESFRKSKYSQSVIGDSYLKARQFLREGKYVLFSGTPCQIAGLMRFLSIGKTDIARLLTVEVVCEGVPSPLYIRKMNSYVREKYNSKIFNLDYRFKDGKYDNINIHNNVTRKGRWDFEVMSIILNNGKQLKRDRWFNPFWSIWLNHLMNRPSCYVCLFTTKQRIADITLGDLWGVHIYCPELYGSNGGASLMISNTLKGHEAAYQASKLMLGHTLNIDDAVKFQGPMRKCVPMNPLRKEFMNELIDPAISYKELNKKWVKKPTIKLIISKYLWGNHQKVRLTNLKQKLFRK